jgi:nitrite reductase/ring-hydroxylating ferredoxin subunit
VQCPWHGSQFDTTDGSVKAGPAKQNIPIYTLSERNGNVYVVL